MPRVEHGAPGLISILLPKEFQRKRDIEKQSPVSHWSMRVLNPKCNGHLYASKIMIRRYAGRKSGPHRRAPLLAVRQRDRRPESAKREYAVLPRRERRELLDRQPHPVLVPL